MRTRFKECHFCKMKGNSLSCKYNNFKEWIFLCGKCLNQIKSDYQDTYQYGGTWKSKKDNLNAMTVLNISN